MVNPTGRNGTDNGTVPPDDQLQVALRMYEIEGLPIKERLGRLEAEFGYCIKKKKLNTLNNKFGILSARKTSKTMSQSIATSLVVAQLDRDVHSRNGPEAIKRFLAIRGISIPRRMIRIAAREHDPYKDKSGLCSRCHILDALKELPNEQTRLAEFSQCVLCGRVTEVPLKGGVCLSCQEIERRLEVQNMVERANEHRLDAWSIRMFGHAEHD